MRAHLPAAVLRSPSRQMPLNAPLVRFGHGWRARGWWRRTALPAWRPATGFPSPRAPVSVVHPAIRGCCGPHRPVSIRAVSMVVPSISVPLPTEMAQATWRGLGQELFGLFWDSRPYSFRSTCAPYHCSYSGFENIGAGRGPPRLAKHLHGRFAREFRPKGPAGPLAASPGCAGAPNPIGSSPARARPA